MQSAQLSRIQATPPSRSNKPTHQTFATREKNNSLSGHSPMCRSVWLQLTLKKLGSMGSSSSFCNFTSFYAFVVMSWGIYFVSEKCFSFLLFPAYVSASPFSTLLLTAPPQLAPFVHSGVYFLPTSLMKVLNNTGWSWPAPTVFSGLTSKWPVRDTVRDSATCKHILVHVLKTVSSVHHWTESETSQEACWVPVPATWVYLSQSTYK